MYLIEIKNGDYIIRKYVISLEEIERLKENPIYDYVKIIEEDNIKVRRKKK